MKKPLFIQISFWLVVVFFSGLLAVQLGGCGSSSGDSPTTTSSATTSTTTTGSATTTTTLPGYLHLIKSITLEGASIWGGISYDGTNINITTMNNGHIYLKKYNTDLVETAAAVQLTFNSDLPSGKSLADHKHLYINDHLYVTWSTSGDEYLFLFKTDANGVREGSLVTVEANSSIMTNDMHFVTDGTYLYIMIGEGNPSKDKKVYKYDLNLDKLADSPVILTKNVNFSPLGTTVYKDGKFYTFSGNDDNHNLIATVWSSWADTNPLQTTLVTSENSEWNYFSTGAAFDSTNNRWYLGYINKSSDGLDENATIEAATFDADFTLLGHQSLTDRGYLRPHFLLLNGYLFVVYDDNGVHLSKYSISTN